MNFNYMQPVKIIFGNNELSKLNGLLSNYQGSGILICDQLFVDSGLVKKICDENKQLKYIFSNVSANPDTSEADECIKIMRDNKVAFIVALGGGSVIDLAKVCGSVALTKQNVDYYHGTGIALPNEHLPLIAIPSTSGTGSEVTCAAVMTNRALGKKAPIVSDNFYPEYALIDPVLTYSVPPHITAATGMDVLCHGLEAFWSTGRQPICDALALSACRTVFDYLLKAYHDPCDYKAREKMAEASLIAGLAFSIPKTTSSHACSFPLTNIYGICHGEACALTIDYFALINKDDRLDEFAKNLGFDDVEAMAKRIYEMKVEMGLRVDLKDLNINEEQLNDLIVISRHPNLYNNPVEITDEMLETMYRSMM